MSFYCKYLVTFFLCVVLNENIAAQNADIELLRSINVSRNTSLDASMKLISNTEDFISIGLPVSIVIASYVKHDKVLFQHGINMGLALAASAASTYILKRVVNRPRPSYTYPDIQALESYKYFSFPSGHTSNAFCTATSFSLNFKRWYYVVPAFAWAGVVGYSRMHLGVHYPSDVLAGALLGAGSAYATYQVNKVLKRHFESKYLKGKPEPGI